MAVRPPGKWRYNVEALHPTCRATSAAVMVPDASIAFAAVTFRALSAGGRPPIRPRARLAASAVLVRSRRSSTSNCPRAAKMWRISRPVDGTGWVALFCQNMAEIAFELAAHDRTYERLASNYMIQFLLIARAMNGVGTDGLWDEQDGFYYDMLRQPDGRSTRLKVRSLVGLLPMCAVTVVEKWQRDRVPNLTEHLFDRLKRMPELRESIHATGPGHLGVAERGIFGLVNESRLRRILTRVLERRTINLPEDFDQVGDHPGPASLMAVGHSILKLSP